MHDPMLLLHSRAHKNGRLRVWNFNRSSQSGQNNWTVLKIEHRSVPSSNGLCTHVCMLHHMHICVTIFSTGSTSFKFYRVTHSYVLLPHSQATLRFILQINAEKNRFFSTAAISNPGMAWERGYQASFHCYIGCGVQTKLPKYIDDLPRNVYILWR